MQQNIQMKTNEIQREGRKKDRLERELRQARTDLDSKAAEIRNLQQSLDQSNANVAKLNGDLRDQKVCSSSGGGGGRFCWPIKLSDFIVQHRTCSLLDDKIGKSFGYWSLW